MSNLNRRQLLHRATAAAASAFAITRPLLAAFPASGPLARLQTPSPSFPAVPRNVAGIPLPDTKLTESARALATGAYPPHLLNHAHRTYVFGALVGRAKKLAFDDELLYLACLLHDLGLTPQFEGELPFEIQGAEAARKFLEQQGLPSEKAEIVWDGIAMHASFIGFFKRPEISLVGEGAGADVLGPDPNDIPSAKVSEVLVAFPRLNFKKRFLESCAEVLKRRPQSAGQTFMRDVRERFVPDYHPRNFCDLVEKAPFEE